jgi:membrane protease YdiL (CAAX protease family)
VIIEKYRRPFLFYSLATLFPWFFWLSAAYVSHIAPPENQYVLLASILGFIGLISPLIIAALFIFQSKDLRNDLLKRFFNFKSANPVYFLLACFLMLTSIILAQAVSLFFGYSASQFVISGNFTFSSGVFPVWFLLIMAPVFEELAWHTYGTDCLRSRFNLFNTSLIFAVFWGFWHLPLSFIQGYYQSNLVASGLIHALNFPISIIPFVLLMNWLYYKTNRNILVAIIFHITAGYFNEIFSTHPDTKIIQTVLLIILATFIVLKERDFFFNRAYQE